MATMENVPNCVDKSEQNRLTVIIQKPIPILLRIPGKTFEIEDE